MDHKKDFTKISYSKEKTFGNYRMAEAKLMAVYANKQDYDPS
jgi:hypothetical protein